MVIHCGDAEGAEEMLQEAAECPFYIVLGNNDFFSDLPRELEIQVGKYKLWVTHGHTHRPVIDLSGPAIALNPGSLSYPRQENRRPSYIIMETDRNGEAHFTVAYL